jgi:hypothetical protein
MNEIHLIERVEDADLTLSRIAQHPYRPSIIVDLTSGRVDAVSKITNDEATLAHQPVWIRAPDLAPVIAEASLAAYVQWVGDVGERNIQGRSLKEWFTFDGVSLWWFTSTAKKGQNTSRYRWLFYTFHLIDQLFDDGTVSDGSVWHIWVPDLATGTMIQEYIGGRGKTRIHAEKSDPRPMSAARSLAISARSVARRLWSALRVTLHTRSERKQLLAELRSSTRERRLAVVTEFPKSWKAVARSESFSHAVREHDFYLGAAPWDLRERGWDVSWVFAASSAREYQLWKKRGVAQQDLPDSSCLAVIDLAATWRILAAHLRWRRTGEALFAGDGTVPRFEYGGADLGRWVIQDFVNMTLGEGVSHAIAIQQYRSAARSLRPRAAIYRNELFLNGRRVSAGMKGRALLVGLQHGIINEEASVYRLDAREAASGTVDHVSSCPLPHLFATFGEHTRELFERWNGFDPQRTIPIGGVRHDNIVRHLATFSDDAVAKRTLKEKLGLPVDRPTILLCTQRRQDVGLWVELVVRGILESGASAFIAVKLHQYHGGEREARQAAETLGFADCTLFEGNTYELIAASDLTVGGPSTIVLESYLLGVPAISIGGHDYESYPYRRESIGTIVSNARQMAEAITETLLTDRVELSEVRRKLCERHIWNDDAGAVERLAALLECPPTGSECSAD